MTFAAGQCWTYRAPPENAQSRLVIGALVDFEAGGRIACCAVTDAMEQRPDAGFPTVTIPFLPMTIEALEASVVRLDGTAPLPEAFASEFEAWRNDQRGARYFSVPFEGSLERMIGLQMAAIIAKR